MAFAGRCSAEGSRTTMYSRSAGGWRSCSLRAVSGTSGASSATSPTSSEMAARLRVGWATSAWRASPRATMRGLPAAVAMRSATIARWIDRHDGRFRNELYRPGRRYDVVVFVKTMDEATQREAERIGVYGGRVVFDANVNYYEVWGEYDVAGTEPT